MGIRSSLTLGDDLGLRPIANNLGGFPGLHLPTELTEACGGFGGGFGPGFDNCLAAGSSLLLESSGSLLLESGGELLLETG